MSKLIVYYGENRARRNSFLIDHVLSLHQHPRLDFLYLVENALRRRQVEHSYRVRFRAGFQIPILTLPSLARRCLGSLGIEALTEAGKLSLLEDILRSSDSPGQSLDTESDNLLRRIAGFIGGLKKRNILDPDLLAIMPPSGTSREMQEILSWSFEHYQRRLQALGIEDWAGHLSSLYQGLLNGRIRLQRHFPDWNLLIVEGHSTIGSIEKGILKLLMGEVQQTVISTDLRPDSIVEEGSPFRDMWTLLGSADEWRPVEDASFSSSASLVSLPSREDEVNWTVSRIGRLRDSGFERIVILSDRPDDYAREFEDQLAIRGQELYEARGSPAFRNPLVLLLRDYLELILGSFPRRRLFDFLQHPRLRTGLTPEELEDLETWAVQCQVESGLQNWSIEFPLRVQNQLLLLTGSARSRCREMLKLARRLCDLVGRLHIEEAERAPRAWVSLLERKLTPLLRPIPPQETGAVRNDHLLLQAVLDRCESEGDLLQNSLNLGQFSDLLQRIAKTTRSRVWTELPALILARPEEVEQLEADAVIWVGLCDREFLPSDSTLGTVTEGEPELDWDEQHRSREMRFAWISGQATRALIYTYPRRKQGASTLPSPFLRGMERQVLGRSEVAGPLPDETRHNISRGRRLLRGREDPAPSIFDGVLDSAQSLALLSPGQEPIVVSPTLLESYATCGFRHFSEHYLGVGGEELSRELTPRELGRVLHRVLHRFVQEFKPQQQGRRAEWEEAARKRLLAALEQELESLPFRDFHREDLFWEVQENLLRSGLSAGSPETGLLVEFLRDLERWCSGHSVLDMERSLGPLLLGRIEAPGSEGSVEVLLQGTIDRVDRGREGLVVIDYKTGRIPLAPIYDGWGFQLPLYVTLADQHYSEPVSEAGFFALELPLRVGFRTVRFPEEPSTGWERLAHIYRRRALEAVASLSRGKFPVTLVGPGRAGCSVCRLRDACAFDPMKAEAIRDAEGFVSPRPILRDGAWVSEAIPERNSGDD